MEAPKKTVQNMLNSEVIEASVFNAIQALAANEKKFYAIPPSWALEAELFLVAEENQEYLDAEFALRFEGKILEAC